MFHDLVTFWYQINITEWNQYSTDLDQYDIRILFEMIRFDSEKSADEGTKEWSTHCVAKTVSASEGCEDCGFHFRRGHLCEENDRWQEVESKSQSIGDEWTYEHKDDIIDST